MISEALGRDDPGEARTARNLCLSYAMFFGTLSTLLLLIGAKPIGILILKDERTVKAMRLLAISLLPIGISSVLNGYFVAVRRVYKNAVCCMLEQGFRIGITSAFLLYVLPKSIENACIALVLGSVLSEILSALLLGILFFIEQRKNKPRKSAIPKPVLRKRLLGISLPIAFSAYARSGLLSIEHMLIPIGLSAFFGDRSVALSSFGILQGVVFPVLLFPSAILSSYAGLLVPEIAECNVRGERERIRKIVMSIIRGTLLFSIGVSGIMLSFSHEIGSVLQSSHEAAYYLRLLAPLIPIMYLDTAADSVLKGHGEQVFCMQVNIIDSLISVLLVWLLLPKMGIEGYILVVYIAEILNASLSITRLLQVTHLKASLFRIWLIPLLSVIGATSMIRMLSGFLKKCVDSLPSGIAAIVFDVILASVLYILLLFLFKAIRKEECARVKRRLFRKAAPQRL
jgi:stage V sporulation protein B